MVFEDLNHSVFCGVQAAFSAVTLSVQTWLTRKSWMPSIASTLMGRIPCKVDAVVDEVVTQVN